MKEIQVYYALQHQIDGKQSFKGFYKFNTEFHSPIVIRLICFLVYWTCKKRKPWQLSTKCNAGPFRRVMFTNFMQCGMPLKRPSLPNTVS
jgi:hypothetical protein